MSYGNNFIRKIYDFSPYSIKNLIATIYGAKAHYQRYGYHFYYWYNFLKKTEYYSSQELTKLRDQITIEFINRVLSHNSYYKKNYNTKFINSITDIKKFNIIDKNEMRNNLELIIDKSYKKLIKSHTSGTTGSSLIFPITLECFQREYAFRAIHYSWSGVNFTSKPKIATFAGHPVAKPRQANPPFWVFDYLNNWLLFSSYHMSELFLRDYVKKLEEFNPVLIHGYPSSVYLVSLAFKKYGKSLTNLKAVYTASETLLDFQRKAIEDAFQVKVYNWYGNSEMCANIVECENGRLHLKYEHSYVEILNEKNQDCKPGDRGRLVCTGFGNPAFPLVRYDIKDEVVVSEETYCPCGRGGLLIKEIVGRIEDYILTPSGKKIGRLDHLFKDTLNIKEAQIYQNKIDAIEIRVVPFNGELLKEDIKKILKEISLRIGDELNVNIIQVSHIERGSNNKFKFVVNELDKYASNNPISKKW